MFSFFKTKKPSPSSSPESDPIPSALPSDFVVVDHRQGGDNPNPNPMPLPYPNFGNQYPYPQPSAMYPPMPGYPPQPAYPPQPNRPQLQHSDSIQHSYVNGVPFKLSSQLTTGDSDEIIKIQVDDILALITSTMEVTKADYDFTLERSLLRQAEAEAEKKEAESREAEPNADEPDEAEPTEE